MPLKILQSKSVLIASMQRILDIILIFMCLYIAQFLSSELVGYEHIITALLTVIMFYVSSEADGMYLSWRGSSVFKLVAKSVSHWTLSFLVVIFTSDVLLQENTLSNHFVVIWFLATAICIGGYRVVLTVLLKVLRSKGFNTRNIVIAGAGDLGQKFAENITNNASFGMTFSGFYDDTQKKSIPSNLFIGNLERLVADVKKGKIDRVYIVLPPHAFERRRWLVNQLADSTASVYIVPDVFTYQLLHAKTDIVMGIPTISIYDSPLDGSSSILKRFEDVFLASVILLLISPILLLISLAVKFTSKGPVIFKQSRYGIDGQKIEVWKFRSMTVMENGNNVSQAQKNDTRFTPIGQFLRKTSLDELPQFFNVLQGSMSIVGPRPHAIAHNEQYRKLVVGYMLRHKVKPGITGWAQINGWRGETDTLYKMEKRVEFDLEYIRNWNILLDLKIIFLTIFKGFVNKNAY